MDLAEKKETVHRLLKSGVLISPDLLEDVPAGQPEEVKDFKVVFSYTSQSKKRSCDDFVSFFNHRYKALESVLRNRPELSNTTSISRIKQKKARESVALIGLILDKQETKNKNIILTLEDLSGSIRVLVNKSKPELLELAKELTYDEVIGVTGMGGPGMVFASNILLPDIPDSELKKGGEECYAVFLSDLHVGSKNFLPAEFNRFLGWINGDAGSPEQKELAAKTKYVFIAGDIVDGVGIYPDQESELDISDIYAQYKACAELLEKIPRRIKVIICPGNHDAMRISEPQPPLSTDIAKPILQLPNVVAVSNPAWLKIGCTKEFEGLDVLLYHGYSFDYYVANVDSIRRKGGYDRADLIMKFLLQRRHLAPTHTSTLYIPDSQGDSLVISRAPDLFVTGHIHKTAVANYKHTTMICGSCWQSRTSFQEKMGHNPEPARVPVVNLKTRRVKVLRFGA